MFFLYHLGQILVNLIHNPKLLVFNLLYSIIIPLLRLTCKTFKNLFLNFQLFVFCSIIIKQTNYLTHLLIIFIYLFLTSHNSFNSLLISLAIHIFNIVFF